MAQHRDAPAYQEYAASMMARTEYRVLSLAGRGLLYSMRLECWVNGGLPSSPPLLARVLGFEADLVERALPELKAFFTIDNGMYRCPELDNYRVHLEARRMKQSQGGRDGAAKTNGVRSGSRTGDPPGKPRATRESSVQNSQVQKSKNQRSNATEPPDPWVNDYERASRGH
jgi:hypothetical protein